jgi:hypothetical protein
MRSTDATDTNLPNLKTAQEEWRKRNPDARDTYKLNELIGALSFYVGSKEWDQALNTTFGYIKAKE